MVRQTGEPVVSRLNDLIRLYDILSSLETQSRGKMLLSACSGRMVWPKRGVYFFFEPGERRSHSGEGLRVVRVGTHALTSGSRTTLWNRLSQHRGTLSSGGGNHRGSIFRLLMGDAIMRSNPDLHCSTWGKGSSAARSIRDDELELERAVSEHVRGMPFLHVSADDPPSPNSKRALIERNAIALLSNANKVHSIDPPSAEWLGRYSTRAAVRQSGLWNSRHTGEPYDASFLDVLEGFVARTGRIEQKATGFAGASRP